MVKRFYPVLLSNVSIGKSIYVKKGSTNSKPLNKTYINSISYISYQGRVRKRLIPLIFIHTLSQIKMKAVM